MVLIITLIICCFIGSTLASYTTCTTGSGTFQFSKWIVSIEGEGTGETALAFGQLSPAKEEYVDTARTHSTAVVAVAAIEYDLDVNATLTFRVGELTFKKGESEVVSYGDYSKEELQEVFSITFYSDNGTTEISVVDGTFTTTLSGKGTYNIYAKVTWTSDLETDVAKGEDGDKRDTWIGANVTTVSCTFGYTAVQATELPNA